MPTIATRRLKRDSDGQLINERLHCGLLQRNQMCQFILFPKIRRGSSYRGGADVILFHNFLLVSLTECDRLYTVARTS